VGEAGVEVHLEIDPALAGKWTGWRSGKFLPMLELGES